MEPNKIVIIKYGKPGYYPTDYIGDAMEYNKKIGVTKPQMDAMKDASIFGWDIAEDNLKLHEEFYDKSN